MALLEQYLELVELCVAVFLHIGVTAIDGIGWWRGCAEGFGERDMGGILRAVGGKSLKEGQAFRHCCVLG